MSALSALRRALCLLVLALAAISYAHYDSILDASTAVGAVKISPAVNDGHASCNSGRCCPVCGMAVAESDPHAVFQRGQKLFACSDDHIAQVAAHPREFMLKHAHQHSEGEVEGKQCPVCGMQASAEHAIDFNGNQSLFFCNMGGGQRKKFLADPGAYVLHLELKNATHDNDRYCTGRTVMYMFSGFTTDDKTCLVLFFKSWILDTRLKMIFACIGCFVLAIAHEALVAVRRQLVYQQRQSRMPHHAYVPLASKPASTEDGMRWRPTAAFKSTTLKLDIAVALLYGVCVYWRTTFYCSLSRFLVSLGMGYCIMLAVMTYHTGLFVAAILGFACGQFFFKDAEAPLAAGEPVEVGGEPCCSG